MSPVILKKRIIDKFKPIFIHKTWSKSGGAFCRDTEVILPSKFGDFRLVSYQNEKSDEVHLALIKGEVTSKEGLLTRIHSSCITGDILGSLRCDCREQLIEAMRLIEKEGSGLVIYAFQEGRGIGLVNKLRTYYFQENGYDTVDANSILGLPEDMRSYEFVKDILEDLGVKSIRLLTNNPDKVEKIGSVGVEIISTVNHEMEPCDANYDYLKAKKDRMGHKLNYV